MFSEIRVCCLMGTDDSYFQMFLGPGVLCLASLLKPSTEIYEGAIDWVSHLEILIKRSLVGKYFKSSTEHSNSYMALKTIILERGVYRLISG